MFKKLGVCLSGGGGKGAYQIGVWQALRDSGLDKQLSAIAGSSVGGLNGAMWAQNRYEQARDMWLNIESRNMLSVQDVPQLASRIATLTGQGVISPLLLKFISTKGLFKQDGLKSMIADGLDASGLVASPLTLTVALHNMDVNRVEYRRVDDEGSAAKMLLGTAALPFIFDDIKIGGTTYSDGGFFWGLPHKNTDNTPIKPLIEAGCDTVVVVYLSPEDLSVDPRQYPGVRIIPIVPTYSLGGLSATLDFSNEGAARRMEQGYNDALHLLRHLELFLSNEQQYEALWERVKMDTAQAAAKLNQQFMATDAQHQDTIADIHHFNRQVQQDDFSQTIEINEADDAPQALDQLALENSALLAHIERKNIEINVHNFITQNRNNRQKVETAVMDALAALAPVTGRATYLRDQGVLSRLWGAITGSNQQIAASNDHDLAQAQFAALRLIAGVQEKGAITLEFTCMLQNRLNQAFAEVNRLGERHNRDLRRVYRSLAGVYCKLRDRMVQHENRLQALERQGRLHHWLLHHGSRPRFYGKTLSELSPELRLACIANDFYHLTEGNWSVQELVSLKQMCINTGLHDDKPVQVAQFCQQLAHTPDCTQALSDNLVILPGTAVPSVQPARWLRDLREHNSTAQMSTEQALTLWGYNAHSTLPAWDFLAELLYHMKTAGFSVVHSSDLGRYKDEWIGQLKALDILIQEKILPTAFKADIEDVSQVIRDFRIKVLLIGKFSVGKSTLLNCWLREDIQQQDLGACTSLATEFHYAPRSEHEKLVVHWVENEHEGTLRRQELPLSSYSTLLNDIHNKTVTPLPIYVELHLNRSALARHPDLILVDTPGFGSGNGNHERALQQYIGEGVACILCVTRTSQIGIDEQGFIGRQSSFGQDFSLLVCQEGLNTPSQREALRQRLAEQAGLESGQLVRGCSAREGDLGGFDDLLARLETQKATLFHANLAKPVYGLLDKAKAELTKRLRQDTTADDLRDKRNQLDKASQQLARDYEQEHSSLLQDCRGRITREVISTAKNYLYSQHDRYSQMLLAGQHVGAELVANARNACQLAIENSLTPRFKEASERLGYRVDQAYHTGDAVYESSHAASLEQDTGLGGAAAGAAAGAAIGTILPVVGTVIGGLLGGVIGFFSSRNSKKSEAESQANDAIEHMIRQLEAKLPALLEQQADLFLKNMNSKMNSKLEAMKQDLNTIDAQLQANEQQRTHIQQQVTQALQQVKTMLECQTEPELAA